MPLSRILHRKRASLPAFAAFVTLTAAIPCASGTYAIADGYAVRFSGRGASGTFAELTGAIRFDTAALDAAAIDVAVATASIATGNATKDGHARGASWLDAAAYPVIRIRSTAFAKAEDGYVMAAELTLHGQTRPVEIPFTFTPRPDDGGTFRGAFTVDREDYGIEGPFGQFVVADELDVELVVPVVGEGTRDTKPNG